jgi:enoyl-CoA hydratase/carnithine racemase
MNVIDCKEEQNYILITLKNGKANAISAEVISELNACLDLFRHKKKKK